MLCWFACSTATIQPNRFRDGCACLLIVLLAMQIVNRAIDALVGKNATDENIVCLGYRKVCQSSC
jgi:hypothetical protein